MLVSISKLVVTHLAFEGQVYIIKVWICICEAIIILGLELQINLTCFWVSSLQITKFHLIDPEHSDYNLACSVQTFKREIFEDLSSYFLSRTCMNHNYEHCSMNVTVEGRGFIKVRWLLLIRRIYLPSGLTCLVARFLYSHFPAVITIIFACSLVCGTMTSQYTLTTFYSSSVYSL